LAGLPAYISAMTAQSSASPATATSDNPLLQDWSGPFGVPPFERIKPEHFQPAYTQAYARHLAEIEAIAANPAEPTFANTIEALETSGDLLTRVEDVFGVISGAHTNDAILEIERELAPIDAQHWNKIYMHEALFRRIDTLHRCRDTLGLTAEQARVLERYHVMHRRRGARRRSQGAARRDQRAPRHARHVFQPECARRRAGLHARA
jgi:peptidyl-dipeptidase Dcp